MLSATFLRPTRPRSRQQQGQTLITFAITFALFIFFVICVVLNLAVMYTTSARANTAALVASQSAANDVDPSALYSGSLQLASNAVQLCEQAGDNVAGPGTTSCTVSGVNVVASVHVNVTLPLMPYSGYHPVVAATQQACAVVGTTAPTGGGSC